MAVKLSDKPNTEAPSSDYPAGNIKDNPGNNSGTPVNKAVYADLHQFFVKLMDYASVAYNGLPENVTNTFQYFTALVKTIQKTIDDYVSVMSVDGVVKVRTKVISIGTWNMTSASSVSVVHGIADFTKIINARAVIVNDLGTSIYPLDVCNFLTGEIQGSVGLIGTTAVELLRTDAGTFTSGFSSTGSSRGKIIVTYLA